MANNQKLELTWIGKDKEIKIEPRILIEDKEKSNCKNDPNTENMLIHGDNLLALKALESKYAGKVKCIYIDPPYNTGSAFEHYDDNLEHSTWLSLMKPRLEILRNLLSDEGVIFVQIDDNEMAYLKVLMDEVFGRNNYVNTVSVLMKNIAGASGGGEDKRLKKNLEYILIYSKNYNAMSIFKPVYKLTRISELVKKYAKVKKAGSTLLYWYRRELRHIFLQLRMETEMKLKSIKEMVCQHCRLEILLRKKEYLLMMYMIITLKKYTGQLCLKAL